MADRLVLRVLQPSEISQPGDLFRCPEFGGGCTLAAGACVARQEAHHKQNGAPVHVPCGRVRLGKATPAVRAQYEPETRCILGRIIRGQLPKDWKPKPYSAIRSDLAEVYRARMMQRLTTVLPASAGAVVERSGAGWARRRKQESETRDTAAAREFVKALPPIPEKPKPMLPTEEPCKCGCGKPVRKNSVDGFRPACRRRSMPDVKGLPLSFLKKCVLELVRRTGAPA